jgi:hypothetical protein
VRGARLAVREAVSYSNRIRVCNNLEFDQSDERFDRAFCINVLSAIPIMAVRRRVIETILYHLKPQGTCLFVVQYRNSDFTRMRDMPNARPWKDGFIIDSLRGFSFYGLITPESLTSLVQECGFMVTNLQRHHGSAYVWASRP